MPKDMLRTLQLNSIEFVVYEKNKHEHIHGGPI